MSIITDLIAFADGVAANVEGLFARKTFLQIKRSTSNAPDIEILSCKQVWFRKGTQKLFKLF